MPSAAGKGGVDRGSGMVTSRSNKAGIGCLRGPLSRFHLAFAMLQLDNAPPCGGSRGLERFAPAEREGAVAPGTLTPTIPFWKLCRARPRTRRASLRSSQKENPAGESGVFKGQLGDRGDLGSRPSSFSRTSFWRGSIGFGRGRAGRDGHGQGSRSAPSGANQKRSPALTSC
jgi:hypothetical protein